MFRHQDYDRPGPHGQFQLLTPPSLDPAPAAEQLAAEQLADAVATIADAGVRDLVLIHGTFFGSDPWGLARKVSRIWPSGGKSVRQQFRQAADRLAGDAGNYDPSVMQQLRTAIDQAGAPLRLHRLDWSGENHHMGRADGAVRLLRLLNDCPDRVLMVSHSHGGNVAAMVTQLLCCEAAAWQAFLVAARPYYRRRGASDDALAGWHWALQSEGARRLDAEQLDVVTCGTPVRYGWGPCRRLLHFIHHRPGRSDLPPWQSVFPPEAGDWVQQLGIAGTNLAPGWFSWRARYANRRLSQLLQGPLRRRDLLRRWHNGVRLHDSGDNLLVDYEAADEGARAVLGHAVYTRRTWLAFHFQEIASRLYGDAADKGDGTARAGEF